MIKFADIVEEVKNLSVEEKGELSEILDHILIAERRQEFLKNHDTSLEELKAGKLKSYDSAIDIIKALNED